MNSHSIRELMDLHGRTALITGGAGHIGANMAAALGELGADLIILDFAEASCIEVCKQLRTTYGISAEPLVVDLANETEVSNVPKLVEQLSGRLDILVHCAALVGTSDLSGWAVPFEEQSTDTWRSALEINLTAAFALIKGCTPLLRSSGHGSIINISSIYGVVAPYPDIYENSDIGITPAAYASSKGGLLQLTRWLATVLAPDIRVNAITPGGVSRGQPERFRQEYIARTPLQRMGKETDLKGAIAYLASDLSAYVTGQNIIVDGGWTIW